MKIPALPKPLGQRQWNLAVERRPDKLYKSNYSILAETPKREHLFMGTPAGEPAVAKMPKISSANSSNHWSGK